MASSSSGGSPTSSGGATSSSSGGGSSSGASTSSSGGASNPCQAADDAIRAKYEDCGLAYPDDEDGDDTCSAADQAFYEGLAACYEPVTCAALEGNDQPVLDAYEDCVHELNGDDSDTEGGQRCAAAADRIAARLNTCSDQDLPDAGEEGEQDCSLAQAEAAEALADCYDAASCDAINDPGGDAGASFVDCLSNVQ